MSLASFVIVAAFATAAAAQSTSTVQVNTPTGVQACVPTQLSWSGGEPPYYVSLIAGGQPSSPILKDFGSQTGTSLTWPTDMPAGQSYTVQIRDKSGSLNYSDKFTVQPSTVNCSPSTSSNTTAPATSPTTGGKTGNTTSPTTGSTTSPTTGSTSNGTAKSGTSTSTTPSTGGSTSSTGTSTSVNGSSSGAGTQAQNSAAGRLSASVLALGVSVALAVFA